MILITGYKGFIGSQLHNLIEATGKDVRDGHNLLTCDLPKDVDVIYHLAAQTSVESSWHDPLHDLDNIRITARLIKEYPDAKIIYANSAAALEPIASPYGFSKWASAEYVKRFHKDYVICTFPNVFGEGSKSVVDIFDQNNEITIYGDGTHTRDYVHCADIVAGLIKAKDWPVGEYEMGSGKSYSVNELVRPRHIVTYSPDRKEAKEVLMKNTTPNWQPSISVMKYIR